jgi:hypothetical protein
MAYALRDMLAAGEEINMYVPTVDDVAWAKDFLTRVHDDGFWGVPRLGIYKISHTDKTLTLVEQWGDDDYFDRDVAVFGMRGYRVVKKLARKIPVELLN